MRKQALVVGGSILPALLLQPLLLPLCSALFQCGCTWQHHGADEFCNVRLPKPPHCPWCDHGWWGWHVPWAFMLAATTSTMFFSRRHWRGQPFAWLLLCLLSWEIWPMAFGGVCAWWWRYPYFLSWRL
ncbi:hypothetical protein JST97_13805 [bacterium]|nr:hypothetical protein [bacterium]